MVCLRREDIKALYDINATIGSLNSVKGVADFVINKVGQIMKADAAIIRLREGGRGRFLPVSAYGIPDNSADKHKAGELIALYVARQGMGIRVADIKKDKRIRYAHAIAKEGWRSLISMPLFQSGYVVGTIDVYRRDAESYNVSDQELMSLFACQVSVAICNAHLFEESRKKYVNTIKIMAGIVDAKDSYISNHSERVMGYSLQIAKRMGLADRQLEIVRYASFLHDIGKVGIDANILRKPGPLNSSEWDQLRMHPKIGADIISNIGFLSNVVPTILHHHSKFGGGGYPDPRLRGDTIPLEARILTVADSFEAMISDRPYRAALSPYEAVLELELNSGTQFDPDVVRVFLQVLEK